MGGSTRVFEIELRNDRISSKKEKRRVRDRYSVPPSSWHARIKKKGLDGPEGVARCSRHKAEEKKKNPKSPTVNENGTNLSSGRHMANTANYPNTPTNEEARKEDAALQ